jgi:hypothetical protein
MPESVELLLVRFQNPCRQEAKTMEDKFIQGSPTPQNIIDIFQGEWSSAMPASSGLISRPGHAELFDDPRVKWLNDELGPLADLDVLELGPLEGAHSYMMQRFGARSVTAIEANVRAFLKCLCIKEIFGLSRVNFLLGDFIRFLEDCGRDFDIITASGVLYHMTEPGRLLSLLAAHTDRLFIWTHYYDEQVIQGHHERDLFGPVEKHVHEGFRFAGSRRSYPESALDWQGFSGGSELFSLWLTRDSIVSYLTAKGYEVSIDFDHPDHPNGPALALCALR